MTKFDTIPKQLHVSCEERLSEQVIPVKNDTWFAMRRKPQYGTGLWTSTWDEQCRSSAWIDLCRQQGPDAVDDLHWHLLEPETPLQLYIIDSYQDLVNLIRTYPWTPKPLVREDNFMMGVDFERLSQKYDGFWLTEQGKKTTRLSFPYDLYSWDCESILWFRWCFQTQEHIMGKGVGS